MKRAAEGRLADVETVMAISREGASRRSGPAWENSALRLAWHIESHFADPVRFCLCRKVIRTVVRHREGDRVRALVKSAGGRRHTLVDPGGIVRTAIQRRVRGRSTSPISRSQALEAKGRWVEVPHGSPRLRR